MSEFNFSQVVAYINTLTEQVMLESELMTISRRPKWRQPKNLRAYIPIVDWTKLPRGAKREFVRKALKHYSAPVKVTASFGQAA